MIYNISLPLPNFNKLMEIVSFNEYMRSVPIIKMKIFLYTIPGKISYQEKMIISKQSYRYKINNSNKCSEDMNQKQKTYFLDINKRIVSRMNITLFICEL